VTYLGVGAKERNNQKKNDSQTAFGYSALKWEVSLHFIASRWAK
jgi:hypothetical protein